LGRRLVQSEPEPGPEARGLLALMLLHESRGSSSVDPVTDLAMLKRQDRSSWSRQHIVEARGLIDRAFGSPHVGSYVLRAAIASVHAEAATFAATDWARVVALHDFLAHADASSVVASSRALAIAIASMKS
jgi:RNA polymerase sigma-70 factor (ECF subfamily)